MRARDIMTRSVVTVSPETTIRDIAQTLLERRISAVPVVDAQNRVVGVVSEGDLLHRAETKTERHRSWWLEFVASAEDLADDYVKSHGLKAKDVMTWPVISTAPDASLAELATLLDRYRIKRVPVLDNGALVGIVSRADLLRGLIGGGRPEAASAASQDDARIREALLTGLDNEPWANTASLNVVVTGGVVELWGFIGSEAERKAFRVAAESTPGVRAVEDHLAVLRSPGWAA
ncbi:MAG: CBS domain-containing protein [Candidatus Eiseniibacteriota bacterium]